MKRAALSACLLVLPLLWVACDDDSGPTDSGDTTAPAAVTDLAADNATKNSIDLTWTAPGDDDTSGTAAQYDIRYSTSTITDGNWGSATAASGEPNPAAAGAQQTFTVTGLAGGTEYYFAMKTGDEVPNWSALSNVAVDTTLPSSLILVASRAGKYAIVNPSTFQDSVEIAPAVSYQPTEWTFGWGCRRVYFNARVDQSGSSAIWGCDAFDGGNVELLTDHTVLNVNVLDGSPVEEKIVFSAYAISDNKLDIYVIDEDGTGQTKLTTFGETLVEPGGTTVEVVSSDKPCWSPDGTKIAYHCNASIVPGGGLPQDLIVVMNADGSGKEVLFVHEGTAWYEPPTWSYDGEFVIFNHVKPGGGGDREILALHVDTKLTSDLSAGLGSTPYDPTVVTCSPDEWKLVFDRYYPGQSPLFLANLSATGTAMSVVGSASQASPDGTGHGFGDPDWAPFYPEW